MKIAAVAYEVVELRDIRFGIGLKGVQRIFEVVTAAFLQGEQFILECVARLTQRIVAVGIAVSLRKHSVRQCLQFSYGFLEMRELIPYGLGGADTVAAAVVEHSPDQQ